MSKEDIEQIFPNLAKTGYTITSPQTVDYNCIAWAAEDDETWWWPDSFNMYYWPSRIPRKVTLEAFIEAYKTLGYMVCDNSLYEKGFQKIAIYVDTDGTPIHVARQLNNGSWTSKLGNLQDITHDKLEGLGGGLDYDGYGEAKTFMKRPLR